MKKKIVLFYWTILPLRCVLEKFFILIRFLIWWNRFMIQFPLIFNTLAKLIRLQTFFVQILTLSSIVKWKILALASIFVFFVGTVQCSFYKMISIASSLNNLPFWWYWYFYHSGGYLNVTQSRIDQRWKREPQPYGNFHSNKIDRMKKLSSNVKQLATVWNIKSSNFKITCDNDVQCLTENVYLVSQCRKRVFVGSTKMDAFTFWLWFQENVQGFGPPGILFMKWSTANRQTKRLNYWMVSRRV